MEALKPEPRIPKEVRAVLYAKAYAQMVPVARVHGYALALHGSMTRDLDVVAVPWLLGSSSPETLLDSLTECLGWDKANGDGAPTMKLHGRLAMTIVDHETGLWVDLSVMNTRPSTGEGLREQESAEGWMLEEELQEMKARFLENQYGGSDIYSVPKLCDMALAALRMHKGSAQPVEPSTGEAEALRERERLLIGCREVDAKLMEDEPSLATLAHAFWDIEQAALQRGKGR